MTKGTPPPFVVQKLWPGETFVVVATGPSLTAEDVEYCRGKARVIVVNDAYKFALWADCLYACDSKWWGWAHRNHQGQHPTFKQFTGLKFGMKPYPGVRTLRNTGETGLELDPSGLRTGNNSGYQAINLAVHLGAATIYLLGFDMKPGDKKKGPHFFGHHPDRSQPPYNACIKAFASLVKPLAAAGVAIVNCTPGSALTCFPMARIQDVLPATVPIEVAS